MIISFCGHSDFYETGNIRERMLNSIANIADNKQVDFYLGGYGGFDSFAYSCAAQYKKIHPSARLIFVTPYIDEKYLATRKSGYDEIIYPNIENKHKKFAIIYRNRWMIEKADTVISYVNRSVGGAYQAYKYAESVGKELINLA